MNPASGEQIVTTEQRGWSLRTIPPLLTAIGVLLDYRIAAGAVVCSDGTAAYVKAAVTAGVEHHLWWC